MEVLMHPCTFWEDRFSGFARYRREHAALLMQLGVNVHIPIRETPNKLRARGAKRPTRFSWEKCAAETKATYQRAIDHKKP